MTVFSVTLTTVRIFS